MYISGAHVVLNRGGGCVPRRRCSRVPSNTNQNYTDVFPFCSHFYLTQRSRKRIKEINLFRRPVALRQLQSLDRPPGCQVQHTNTFGNSRQSLLCRYIVYGYYYEDKLGVCRPIDCCLPAGCWPPTSLYIYENITELKIAETAAMHNVMTHNGFRLSHTLTREMLSAKIQKSGHQSPIKRKSCSCHGR